jgi:hypothetical protein
MTNKRGYFKRLKDHPGLGMATILTLMGAVAGGSNESFNNIWYGVLFGTAVMGGFVWGMVLISNFNRE